LKTILRQSIFVIPGILAEAGLSFVGEPCNLPIVSLLLVILGGPRKWVLKLKVVELLTD
jgi:hypothetical protein